MSKTKYEATFNIKDGKLNDKVMRDVEEFFSQIGEMDTSEPTPVESPKTEIVIKEGGKEITLTTFCRKPSQGKPTATEKKPILSKSPASEEKQIQVRPPISEQIRKKST